MTGIFVFYVVTLETELEILSCAVSCICSNYSFILLIATVHCFYNVGCCLQHVQMLVYSRQVAFDATVQTLEAHYTHTDNPARTDNSLEISHLSVQIYTSRHNTQAFLGVIVATFMLRHNNRPLAILLHVIYNRWH